MVDLKNLIDPVDMNGKSFLDVGCGSGLSSVCAALLGAGRVTAMDVDPLCVETSRRMCDRFFGATEYSGRNPGIGSRPEYA